VWSYLRLLPTRVDSGEFTCKILALISIYAPVVIMIIAVIAVLFSFFWMFLPQPRAMGQLLVRLLGWRERRRWGR
jgi:hypothetical protein